MDFDLQTGLPVLRKYPGVSKTFSFDFAPELVGTTISSIDSVTGVSRNNISGSGSVSIPSTGYSGNYGQARISGGTDGEDYVITYTISAANGDTLVGKGLLQVRDTP